MSREKHFYILQDVRRLLRDRGLPVAWPVDRDPVWEVPHLAYFAALDAGVGRGTWNGCTRRAGWRAGTCATAARSPGSRGTRAARRPAGRAADDPTLRARGWRRC
ncbi:hypothetical protein NKH77_20400 [Streptomyces sp. M19]